MNTAGAALLYRGKRAGYWAAWLGWAAGMAGSWYAFDSLTADILLLGASGGLFIVPLYALVQQRSDPARRARVIAANNIVNAFYMAVGALGAAKLLLSGVSLLTLFIGVALANAFITGLICLAEPEFPKRFAALARSWIERMTGR